MCLSPVVSSHLSYFVVTEREASWRRSKEFVMQSDHSALCVSKRNHKNNNNNNIKSKKLY